MREGLLGPSSFWWPNCFILNKDYVRAAALPKIQTATSRLSQALPLGSLLCPLRPIDYFFSAFKSLCLVSSKKWSCPCFFLVYLECNAGFKLSVTKKFSQELHFWVLKNLGLWDFGRDYTMWRCLMLRTNLIALCQWSPRHLVMSSSINSIAGHNDGRRSVCGPAIHALCASSTSLCGMWDLYSKVLRGTPR